MDELTAFKKYEAYERLCFEEVQLLRNYAWRKLNGWTPNRDFYQAVYDDCNNLYLVIEWRKKHQHCAVARKGEKVVGNAIEKNVSWTIFYLIYSTKKLWLCLLA